MSRIHSWEGLVRKQAARARATCRPRPPVLPSSKVGLSYNEDLAILLSVGLGEHPSGLILDLVPRG